MAASPASPGNLGFLTILRDPTGYLGGYLVTNAWGRPLEFRLSSAVQPNRVQQILYGPTLESFICGDLIGKTLIDKTTAAAQVLFTDHPAVLELRRRLDWPVALVNPSDQANPLACHPQFPADDAALRDLRAALGSLDLSEPFSRIREALAEARKLGVSRSGTSLAA